MQVLRLTGHMHTTLLAFTLFLHQPKGMPIPLTNFVLRSWHGKENATTSPPHTNYRIHPFAALMHLWTGLHTTSTHLPSYTIMKTSTAYSQTLPLNIHLCVSQLFASTSHHLKAGSQFSITSSKTTLASGSYNLPPRKS